MQKLSLAHQSRHSDFNVVVYKVSFPIYNLPWHVNNYFSRQGKGIKGKNENAKDY